MTAALAAGARLAASALALWCLAGGVARSLRRADPGLAPDERLCAVTVWTALALIVSGELLGALGLLTFPLWALGMILIGAGLRVAARGTPPAPIGTPASAPPTAIFRLALAGALLGRAAYALRNPPTDRDSVSYHLPMISRWITTHALGAEMWAPAYFARFYPGNCELLQTWAAFSTGRDTLIAWPGLVALGVGAVALRGLMTDFGASRRVAETMALAFLAAPGVFKLTQGLSVDLFTLAWTAVALRALLTWRRTSRASDAALAFAALGLLAGSRYNAYPFVALAIALAWAVPNPSGRAAPPRSAIAWLALVVPGGFWLARNVLASGNPIFPFDVHVAGLHFAGIPGSADLARTAQIVVWREGYAGHLTPGHLWSVFGVAAPALGAGLLLAMARLRRTSPERARRAEAWLLALLAVVSIALYLVSYFSGANRPASPGRPLELAVGNLRYLIPALVALAPLAAPGLSLTRALATVAAIGLGAAALIQLRPFLGHVVPGLIVAAALTPLFHLVKGRGPRWGLAAALLIAIAALVPRLDRQRADIMRRFWDETSVREPVLPARAADRVLALARGGAIACVGMDRPYQLAARDFSQPAVYVPVEKTWEESVRAWHFVLDDRTRPDRARWLANLAAARARAVVVVTSDEDPMPIERSWCDSDSARFRRDLVLGRVSLYEVR